MITGPSMKLWWFDAKITGPSRSPRCSRPSTRIQAKARVNGRIHTGRFTRRIARANHDRFHTGKSTGSAGGASLVAARSTSARSCPRSRASANDASSMRVSNVSSSATISSTRSSELSPNSSSVVCGERSARPAYLATRAASASPPDGAGRASVPPAITHSRMAARLSLPVPSVRGSSGSGQTSARRIF